jgi:hypothetical protein
LWKRKTGGGGLKLCIEDMGVVDNN